MVGSYAPGALVWRTAAQRKYQRTRGGSKTTTAACDSITSGAALQSLAAVLRLAIAEAKLVTAENRGNSSSYPTHWAVQLRTAVVLFSSS